MSKHVFSRSVLAVALSSALVAGTALAAPSAALSGKAEAATEAGSLAGKLETATEQTGNSLEQAASKAGTLMNDSVITGKVKSALLNDERISSVDISVETNNGKVVLSGFVPEQRQAERAVAVAQGVKGVTAVDDQLHVQAAGETEDGSLAELAGDALITGKIKALLLADEVVAGTSVSVETDKGVVHLSGEVDSQAQAEQAARLAGTVEGVTTVKNDIRVVNG
ncbi:molecular chaperone OsmY [Oceanimonas pelagia]|uniref:Osmotically-inducible protein Y n=1 Tax=Oceanimonas pelagia TaxID=3028314 RepID=A0AA50Q6G1_9GAMM|nr:molecular chaperone OsmY [Oceanimonas pelagia]WMC09325.1 molecular chaperone OsmY [Oceanimonas pelagia]